MTDLNQIDELAQNVFGRRVPHEWFDNLRLHAPGYRHSEPESPGSWVVTRHQDFVDGIRHLRLRRVAP